jgi:hypothetical protein
MLQIQPTLLFNHPSKKEKKRNQRLEEKEEEEEVEGYGRHNRTCTGVDVSAS